jgi:hypothetical protein
MHYKIVQLLFVMWEIRLISTRICSAPCLKWSCLSTSNLTDQLLAKMSHKHARKRKLWAYNEKLCDCHSPYVNVWLVISRLSWVYRLDGQTEIWRIHISKIKKGNGRMKTFRMCALWSKGLRIFIRGAIKLFPDWPRDDTTAAGKNFYRWRAGRSLPRPFLYMHEIFPNKKILPLI